MSNTIYCISYIIDSAVWKCPATVAQCYRVGAVSATGWGSASTDRDANDRERNFRRYLISRILWFTG
ncbi:MAG: hypothetical protein BMS9Abin37_1005 [Acidobacteriota bacterium]|nr:MAG: hypothetical protein BMS9Abin37_1005 [Acidobacteriota bacterium]